MNITINNKQYQCDSFWLDQPCIYISFTADQDINWNESLTITCEGQTYTGYKYVYRTIYADNHVQVLLDNSI